MKMPHIGETLSNWMTTSRLQTHQGLAENLEADVVIVGGGIAGMLSAHLLQKEGKRVIVLEDSQIGSGQTMRSTVQCVTALDRRYTELNRYHSDDHLELAAESHKVAIDRLEAIAKELPVDCEFSRVDGYLCLGRDSEVSELEEELEAARKVGLTDVELVESAPIHLNAGPALRFPDQAQFHPGHFLNGLVQEFVARGGRLFTNTHVKDVKGGADASVGTSLGYQVKAKSVVVATNSPISNLVSIHTKQAPYRTYVVGFLIPKDSIQPALFWDTEDPFHYVRVAKENDKQDILLVGGEDHKTGQNHNPRDCFERLEKWTQERFPVGDRSFYQWSGQVMESVDGLAYLGHNAGDFENVYVITGDSGNGITSAMIGAIIINDQIQGRENAWAEVYNPSRINVRAGVEFIKENANVALQYADWFSAEPLRELVELKIGEGTVITQGMRKLAVLKKSADEVDVKSAVCPHLGCIVAWNTVEKSWDCPCHGSRFDCHGKVMEGPATESLKAVEDVEIEIPVREPRDSHPRME